MSRLQLQNKYLNLSVLFAGLASLLLWYSFRPGRPDPATTKLLEDLANPKNEEEEGDDEGTESTPKAGNTANESKTPTKGTTSVAENTPLSSNCTPSKPKATSSDGEGRKSELASIHQQIEEIDKRGKALYKDKKFLEAAEVFTEALDLITSSMDLDDKDSNGKLHKQFITVTNNRSAMYEKASMPDLALHGQCYANSDFGFLISK